MECQFTKIFLLVIGFLLATSLPQSDAQLGVCYGLLGDNLPPPQEVVALLRAHNLRRIRLYDPNRAVLDALRGTSIELMLGVPNVDLPSLASSRASAASWVQSNVLSYSPDVNFTYIIVGNEISPVNDNSGFSAHLLPAMENIQEALSGADLSTRVKVSSSFDASILGNSYPPSAGSFRPEIRGFLGPILGFLAQNGAPLLANVYPYFAYASNTRDVRLDYALFTAPGYVVADAGLRYQNMFDAMVDSLYSALERAGFGSMGVVVSETGWPSGGGTSTSVENERIYVTSLAQHVRRGTPKRPGKPIETYIFAMFDENLKDGQEVEKYWGLFRPNKESKFPMAF